MRGHRALVLGAGEGEGRHPEFGECARSAALRRGEEPNDDLIFGGIRMDESVDGSRRITVGPRTKMSVRGSTELRGRHRRRGHRGGCVRARRQRRVRVATFPSRSRRARRTMGDLALVGFVPARSDAAPCLAPHATPLKRRLRVARQVERQAMGRARRAAKCSLSMSVGPRGRAMSSSRSDSHRAPPTLEPKGAHPSRAGGCAWWRWRRGSCRRG